MRIIDLYDLERKTVQSEKFKKGLMADIESVAKVQFEDNKFDKFIVKFRLEKIEKPEGYF